MAKKVVVLFSGGLDSLLTLKILEKAGLDVLGVHFVTWFNTPKYTQPEDFTDTVRTYGRLEIKHIDVSEEHRDLLIRPRYGYGSGVNPCLDCKILFFRKAKELSEHTGAHFVASGEVIGQRPMTQRLDTLRLVEKESRLSGYLLRPLSAKLLPPTVPEQLGWVERDSLYKISGRSRKPQIALAEKYGIEEYPSPAGGCLLTDNQFQIRFNDLLRYTDEVSVDDLTVLRYGRHFRLASDCKLVLGRHQRENEHLRRIRWGNLRLDPVNTGGPFGLMQWPGTVSLFRMALSISARYCDATPTASVVFCVQHGGRDREVTYRGTPSKLLCEEKILI
jgi:tRNA-specific 2-thiouridylase